MSYDRTSGNTLDNGDYHPTGYPNTHGLLLSLKAKNLLRGGREKDQPLRRPSTHTAPLHSRKVCLQAAETPVGSQDGADAVPRPRLSAPHTVQPGTPCRAHSPPATLTLLPHRIPALRLLPTAEGISRAHRTTLYGKRKDGSTTQGEGSAVLPTTQHTQVQCGYNTTEGRGLSKYLRISCWPQTNLHSPTLRNSDFQKLLLRP